MGTTLFQDYFEDESQQYEGVRISPGRAVPIISHYTAGIIGAIHLPRMWLKGLLYGVDLLGEGYGFGPGGIDRIVTLKLGLDPEPFITYLTQAFPTYRACEEWVREHAEMLPETVSASNAAVLATPLRGNLGDRFRAFYGLDDSSLTGIMLNNIDDWWTIHALVTENDASSVGPIVPALSSTVTGPAGIMHLPRFWLRTLLAARSVLADADTRRDELDRHTAEHLQFDQVAATTFIVSTLPSYLRFETWVRQHGRRTDTAAIVAHNEFVRLTASWADDLRDWDAMHAQVVERRKRLNLPLRTPPRDRAAYRPAVYASEAGSSASG